MKVAVASNDRMSVSQHFGKSCWFIVFEADEHSVVEIEARANGEIRPEADCEDNDATGCGHVAGRCGTQDHGQGRDHHTRLIDLLADCDAVIAGGMGPGAMTALEAVGITVALCPFDCSAERAVTLLVSGAASEGPAEPGCSCHH